MNNRIHYELDRFKQHLKKNYPIYLSVLIGIIIYKKGYKKGYMNGVWSMETDDIRVKTIDIDKLSVDLLKNKKVIDNFILKFDRPIFENMIAER